MRVDVSRSAICALAICALLTCPGADSFGVEASASSKVIAINSVPVAEVEVGKDYRYQLTTVPGDPSDERHFALRKGPVAMTVSKDGTLMWTPRLDDLGDHAVSVSVKSAQYGESIQSFFVTVTTPWTEQSPVRTLTYHDSADGKRVFRVGMLMINTLPDPVVDNPMTPRLEFYTPEKLGHLFFNHPLGSNAFLREASYGRVSLQGTVVGWLNAPKKGVKDSDIANDTNYYFGLAKEHMDFTKYDVFVVHALVEGDGRQSGWLYPAQTVKTPQGMISNVGLVWMINSAVFDTAPLKSSNWSSGDAVLPSTSWAHEFLHTFGITGHANCFSCGQSTLSSTGSPNPIKAYGGVFSIMGEHAFACHPDVMMKSRLGWIEVDQLPTIKQSGSYDIYPLGTRDANVKGLFIPVSPEFKPESGDSVFDGFIVEYRTPVGFDRYLERLDGSAFLDRYYNPGGKVDRNGVIIYLRYKSKETDGTLLLDANPETTFNEKQGIKLRGNVGKFADAILTINKTFSHNNVSITPMGVTEKGAMRVEVKVSP